MTGPACPVGVLLSYGAYLPRGRLDLAEIGATLGSGTGAGRGRRVGGRPGSCVSFVSIVGGVRG